MPDAFDWELGKGRGDAAAKVGGRGVEGEIETGGQLHGAQDTKRVLDEGGADVAEAAGAQIGLSAVGVDEVAGGGIPGDGVQGEVAAGGGLGVAEGRVGGYGGG